MRRWFALAQGPEASMYDCYQEIDDTMIYQGLLRLDALKRALGEDPLIIVVTGHHWSCVDVILPKIKERMLRQALPHMVEDVIWVPATEMHCVLPAQYTPGEHCTVWVLSRDFMQAWKQILASEGLKVTALIPACLLLPVSAHHTAMMLYEDSLWVRHHATQGYCLHVIEAQALIAKLVSSPDVDAYGELPKSFTEKFTHVHRQMLRLQDCLKQAQDFPVNFLQGAFKPQRARQHTHQKPMIAAGLVFACALVVHMVYLGASHAILSTRLSHLKAETLALYQRVYPDATAVSSPRALIARALQAQGSTENPLSELLDALATAMQAHPLQISQLDYREQHLSVTGMVDDFSAMEALVAQLKASGISVVQQRAEQVADKVELSLMLSH